MDMTDTFTELAQRVGILEGYNEAINNGAAGQKLRVENVDYSLEPEVPHDREEIWDRVCKAASHKLSDGAEVRDLAWFKEHGYMLAEFSQLEWYLYPRIKDQGLRFELPYQERILRHGTQLAHRLHEIGVQWWDTQLEEYEPMPGYQRFPDIWIEFAREEGRDPDEFPMWALTARSTQYSWGANVGIPVIKEVADNIAGHGGVIINRARARELGLADGDPVAIESATGITRGHAVLREGIRPDTVVMIGQFDHWKTPIAKDFHLPSLNSVTAIALSLTDATGSSADLARVKVYRDESPRQAAE
jgi:phenylacetyl-CoA:acceptor oxidoreductase